MSVTTEKPRSQLFALFREAWPQKPYPLVVDHLDAADGRVCPAASLYNHGRVMGDALRRVELLPGEVVACFPATWIEWIGMLQGCLRRGAAFAPAPVGRELDEAEWVHAVGARVVLRSDGSTERREGGRRSLPGSLVVGPPAMEITEAELLAATQPGRVDPSLEPQAPIWLDDRMAPLAEALAVVTLLRAETELHLGAPLAEAMQRADDDHRVFGSQGSSAAVGVLRASPPEPSR